MLAKEKTGQHDGLRATKKLYTIELTVISNHPWPIITYMANYYV